MKRFVIVVQVWLLLLVVCTVLTVLAFGQIDVPLARHFWSTGTSVSPFSTAFGAGVILASESAVALTLVLIRLLRGHLSLFEEAVAIGCVTSICAYGINDAVVKPIFGVPSPTDVIKGAAHAFNWLGGSERSSFPSGHMVLAAAFAGVFMRYYRASIWPFSALLLLAAGLLIYGDWHFLSDVIAGAFVGLSAGFLAGEAMWAQAS
jgi:membrane-associated phospholipid phosphatase